MNTGEKKMSEKDMKTIHGGIEDNGAPKSDSGKSGICNPASCCKSTCCPANN
ncbi:MAG: hypothetical protein GY757_33240 [bacterium]|nr:hypothetical protein [bacterium]